MTLDPTVMKALVFDRASRGRLAYRPAPVPRAGRNQIVVQIRASSLNPHDWKYHDTLRKIYQQPVPMPTLTVGHDLSGTVVETGRRVDRFKVGDEVFAMSMKTGAFGEYLALDQRMAAPKPKNLSHREAASLPMVTLTAWHAFMLAKLQAGDQVLIVGGSGGVGSHAVQIARAKGAHVAAVCSTANAQLVASLGAERIVDYKHEDVFGLGRRFDVVFDTVGTFSPLSVKRVLAQGGRFVSIANSAANVVATFVSRVPGMPLSRTTTFVALPIGRHLEEIGKLVEAGALRPVIDREFPIEDIDAAIAYSKTGRARGKIVITIA